jgi:hypothetical protein
MRFNWRLHLSSAVNLNRGEPMKTRTTLVAAIVLLTVGGALAGDLPDSQKTPGVALTKVPDTKTAKCISQKMGTPIAIGDAVSLTMICAEGYTQCVRSVPSETKTAVYKSYGLSGNHMGYCDSDQGCEVDHLISLELGGSNDQKNLWPEPYEGEQWNAHVKDQLENFLHAEACAGRMPLKQAQKEISSNWIEAYKKYLGGQPESGITPSR